MKSQQKSAATQDPRIFLSYRRNDGAGWTSKLCDELRLRFGNEAVFKDDDSISAGEDFETRIGYRLDNATAVVAIIGKRWRGQSRWWRRPGIYDKSDWVRKELERAGDTVQFIFPVLIDNALLPRSGSLPASLAYLPRLQATALRPDRWNDDVAAFIKGMEQSMASNTESLEDVVDRRRLVASRQKRRRTVTISAFVAAMIITACFTVPNVIPDPPSLPPSGVCLVRESPASESTLDIGFWNVERFTSEGFARHPPDELKQKTDRLAAALVDMDLDACGLIEVDESTVKGLVANLARRGLSFGHVYQEGLAGFNLALLFRRDRIQCKRADSVYAEHHTRLNEPDPATGSPAFPRIPLFVECKSPRLDSPLLIVVVHFKSMYGGIEATRSRRQHASVIIGEIVSSKANTVVGGTFHALPEEAIAGFGGLSEVGGLRRLFEPDSTADTFIGNPGFAGMLDYIWVSTAVRLREIAGCGAAVVELDSTIADFIETVSDHRPVMISIEQDQ